MARTVIHALRGCEKIARIVMISPHPPAEDLPVCWRYDSGRGLNGELEALKVDLHDAAMLVIHGDLPLVGPDDIEALLFTAEQHGVALAPDRHEEGTNAVAVVMGCAFGFAFGKRSLARHMERASGAGLVRRNGLSFDVDTPEDLDEAIAAGYKPPLA